MKMDIKKVGNFLKNLEESEYQYMLHSINMRNSLQRLIRDFNLTKEDVCKKFEIKPAQYNDFVKGNRNYTISDMAILNAYYMELEAEKLKETAPFQIAGDIKAEDKKS